MTTVIEVDPKDPRTVRVGATLWRLMQSDTGACYATRGGFLTDDQLMCGYEMTLDADTQEELHERLLAQPDAHTAED